LDHARAPRKGETPAQLLIRLDLTIARAHAGDAFTDEINQPDLSRSSTQEIKIS
jgi:hypothetical protein